MIQSEGATGQGGSTSQRKVIQLRPPDYTSLPDRFWSKVDVNEQTGCWEWTASNLRGYGWFGITNPRKTTYAHRLSAADAKGVIPKGSLVLHHCDNPPCVNPEHLYYGTPKDNVRDMFDRGRAVNKGSKGESNGQSKLSEADVIEARTLYATGNHSYASLAKRFGVSTTPMRHAIIGHMWKHLPNPVLDRSHECSGNGRCAKCGRFM